MFKNYNEIISLLDNIQKALKTFILIKQNKVQGMKFELYSPSEGIEYSLKIKEMPSMPGIPKTFSEKIYQVFLVENKCVDSIFSDRSIFIGNIYETAFNVPNVDKLVKNIAQQIVIKSLPDFPNPIYHQIRNLKLDGAGMKVVVTTPDGHVLNDIVLGQSSDTFNAENINNLVIKEFAARAIMLSPKNFNLSFNQA